MTSLDELSTANDSDESLMRAFCGGDQDAFAALFDRHAAAIRAFLVRATGSHALAADLTQMTFLSVVRGRSRFRSDSMFKPWLYAIAVNACNDHYRRNKRERLTDVAALPEIGHDDTHRDPHLTRAVRRALSRLPAAQRETVLLHRFGGFSFAEIAEMVGANESAVKVRAHRAHARLRQLLKDVWVDDA